MTRIFKVVGLVVVILLLCLALVGCHAGLSVEITWPYDGMRVYATPIGVKGAVSDSSAKITINNTPVVVAENGYFIGSVDIVEGGNVITVVAAMKGQETVTKTITVTYVPVG
jgi:sulfur carrier protein ThiS